MTHSYQVAVVGATGAVGQKIMQLLAESSLPIANLRPLASARSAGKKINFKEGKLEIEELTNDSFTGIDLAFFSAGGSISEKYIPLAIEAGAVVIDNSSTYRMTKEVPLVVPEVNPGALENHQGLIANPNCSTIQMMVALEPLRTRFGLERIIVSTYQAVSGAGEAAISELENQLATYLKTKELTNLNAEVLPAAGDDKHFPVAFNALPQIDVFGEDDYTLEEWKMMNETKKIMDDDSLKIVATCVRIPVLTGHSEAIYIELEDDKEVSVTELRQTLAEAPGIELVDEPAKQAYPQALDSLERKETFVGRVRRDPDVRNGFHLWVVADNLVKGAAWNSVQIAEELVARNLLRVPK